MSYPSGTLRYVTGLSLQAQKDEFEAAGIEPRVEDYWAGRLDDWLAAVLPPGAAEWWGFEHDEVERVFLPDETTVQEWTYRQRRGVQSWSFPTVELMDEYIASIRQRSHAEVIALLRLFLFNESCFGRDSEYLHQGIYGLGPDGLDVLKEILPMEYHQRLWGWFDGYAQPHPSIRWVLDLLPHSPQRAIDVILGYAEAYQGIRPYGRTLGLQQAASVIEARWVSGTPEGAEALAALHWRDLERLTAALYRSLGYHVVLTPASKDRGIDVIATRTLRGQREVVLIQVKQRPRVMAKEIQALRGVVARDVANRGVLGTSGRFTRGRKRESGDIVELVDGRNLVEMLNASFGPGWITQFEAVCAGIS